MSTSRANPAQGGGPLGASAFAPPPDIGAADRPALAWDSGLDVSVLTIVRPLLGAAPVGAIAFTPEQWGDRLIRIAVTGGTHLIVRSYGAPELHLFVPTALAPKPGASFGFYLHADSKYAHRIRAAADLRRAIGLGPPLRVRPFAHADRHAAMLYIHDQQAEGKSLRDIAAQLLDPMPGDWRSSSQRSDLRRLAEAASAMVAGGYRSLLSSRHRS